MCNADYPIEPQVESLADLISKAYEIPVYQRYYSWEEKQIDDFLATIINGYSLGKPRCFFGTMQFHQEETDVNCFQVIDGQQRLTTINLFFHVLKVLCTESQYKITPAINTIEINYKNNAKNANKELSKVLSCSTITELKSKPKSKDSDISETYSFYEANTRMLYQKCKK